MKMRELCMLRQILQSSDINLKKMIKTASKKCFQFLCECFLNVVNGNVAINKKLVETHEKAFQKTLSKQTGSKKKKRILGRESYLVITHATTQANK